MRDSALTESMRFLRHRVLVLGLWRGMAWGLLAGLLLLVLFAWLDLVLELSAGLRVAANVACAAGAIVLGGVLLRVAIRAARPAALVRRMDQVGGTRGQILAGWDLLVGSPSPVALSAGMADIAVKRAAILSRRIEGSRAAPSTAAWRAIGALAGLLVVLMILAAAMPRLTRAQWLRFADPFGDHPPYSAIVFSVQPGNQRVVYGSGLDILVSAEGGALDRVDLVLRAPDSGQLETLPMFPEPDGRWRATVANVIEPREYFVRAGRARSEKFAIDVITVPRLEEVTFKVTPPAYTNRPPYEGPLPQGGLAGLPGTRVDIRASSNRPLSAGSVDFSPKSIPSLALAPLASQAREVAGFFEIRQPARAAIKVIDVAGQPSNESFAAPVSVLTDQRPFIRLLQPPEVSFATPTAALAVVLSAEDDYGISRQELYRSLNDSRPLPVGVPVTTPAPTRTQETVILPLDRYGLKPGDVIKLFGRVEDNDPAGAKGSESPIAVVHVISQEQFERMLRTQQGLEVLEAKYEQARRRLESVAEQIEQLRKALATRPADDELAQDMRKQLDSLAEQLRQEAAEIRKAAELELPYDIDKAFREKLESLAASMEQDAQEVQDLAAKPAVSNRQADQRMDELARRLAGKQQEYQEQTTEPLEKLAKVYPLIEDQSRFAELYERQRALAERMAALKGRDNEDDPALKTRMRDLETEQRQIREQLAELAEQIEQHTAQLPEDDEKVRQLRETAAAFVKDLQASGAAEAMAASEGGLSEFNGSRAHAGAQEAADILEKFLSRCQGMGEQGQACLKFQPGLAESLGQTVEQLLADAGLSSGGSKPGRGPMGPGGDSYSMRSNNLRNVGIYGNLPALGEMTRSMAGQNALGIPGPGSGSEGQPGEAWSVDPQEALRAVGASDAAVPTQYRRKVGDYFQQVADELGARPRSSRDDK